MLLETCIPPFQPLCWERGRCDKIVMGMVKSMRMSIYTCIVPLSRDPTEAACDVNMACSNSKESFVNHEHTHRSLSGRHDTGR